MLLLYVVQHLLVNVVELSSCYDHSNIEGKQGTELVHVSLVIDDLSLNQLTLLILLSLELLSHYSISDADNQSLAEKK